jgi:peptidoglycan/xylan/chitin deacetylase (PgdA/CDA1 family)
MNIVNAEVKAIYSFSTDDGYKSYNYQLKKIFDKYNMKFTVNVNGLFVDEASNGIRNDFLTYQDLSTFIKDGYEIGNHSFTHTAPLMPKEAIVINSINNTSIKRVVIKLDISDNYCFLYVNRLKFSYLHSNLEELVEKINNSFMLHDIPFKVSLFDNELEKFSTKYLSNTELILYPGSKNILYFKRGFTLENLRYEVKKTNELILKHCNYDIKTFAYPYGGNTVTVRNILKENGFIAARSVNDVSQRRMLYTKSMFGEYMGGSTHYIMNGYSYKKSYDDLEDNDRYLIPVNPDLKKLFNELNEQYDENTLSEEDINDIRNKFKNFILKSKKLHLWVNLFEHKLYEKLFLYDILLDELSLDEEVKVLTMTEAINFIYSKKPTIEFTTNSIEYNEIGKWGNSSWLKGINNIPVRVPVGIGSKATFNKTMEDGVYKIYLYIVPYKNRNENGTVQIFSSDDGVIDLPVDFKNNKGYIYLGKYRLEGSGVFFQVINTSMEHKISINAIKVERVLGE